MNWGVSGGLLGGMEEMGVGIGTGVLVLDG